MKATEQNKFDTVLSKNTFFFNNEPFEHEYEKHIVSIKTLLLNLKNRVDSREFNEKTVEDLIRNNECGLDAVLALIGLSNESFKRLITTISIVEDDSLSELVNKNSWVIKRDKHNDIAETSDSGITYQIKNNPAFLRGIVNLFFRGSSNPFLIKTLPLFELQKLNISKFCFEIPQLLDTIIRYKEKGSYSGKAENNAEAIIRRELDSCDIPFTQGELPILVKKEHQTKRTMDFIIPDNERPLIIIESSYLTTTSSGQGDKAKTEIAVRELIKKHYPKACFIGIIDGIGWYVRKNDLRRMVSAFDDVFTLNPQEVERLIEFINVTIGNNNDL